MKLNYNEIARDACRRVTVTIDTAKLHRKIYGVFEWRRRLAFLCFKLGTMVMRINLEWKDDAA